jgi:hypothetical protein
MSLRITTTASILAPEFAESFPARQSLPPSSLLAAPSAMDLPILGQLQMLMIQQSQQSREADRKAEAQFDIEEAAAERNRLAEMRSKADGALFSNLISSGVQLACATVSVVSSANQLNALCASNGAQSALATCGNELPAAKEIGSVHGRASITDTVGRLERVQQAATANAKAAAQNVEFAKATGSVLDAGTRGIDAARAGYDSIGKQQFSHSEIRIAGFENQSKAARRAAERLHSEQEAAKQSEAKLMQLAQEIAQAQTQGERAVLLRMA